MLKAYDEILMPDSRFEAFVIRNEATGELRPLDLKDHYEVIAEITLPESVPQSVLAQFDKARNIFIYAWFDYELLTIADGFAYAALELALRIKTAGRETELGNSPALRKLLSAAIQHGWITDDSLARVTGRSVASGYCAILPSMLSELRNDFAHGNYSVFSPSMGLTGIRICADLISVLFAPT